MNIFSKIRKLFKSRTPVTVLNANWEPVLYGYCSEGIIPLLSVDDVAQFICSHGMEDGNLKITKEDGTPFITTFGIFIDRIADMEYREKLLKVLIPMQMDIEDHFLCDGKQ